ncbi:hypothetical protein BaRGS_00010942, partial [Batillaria attramentaria]
SEMMTLATYQSEEMMGPTPRSVQRSSPPLSVSESTPTHTDHTEGTPSFTASSPSCSSDVLDVVAPSTGRTRSSSVDHQADSSSDDSKDEVFTYLFPYFESSFSTQHSTAFPTDILTRIKESGLRSQVPVQNLDYRGSDSTFSEALPLASDTDNVSSTSSAFSSFSDSATVKAAPAAIRIPYHDMKHAALSSDGRTAASLASNTLRSNEKESRLGSSRGGKSASVNSAKPFGRISLPGSEQLYDNVKLRPHPAGTAARAASEPPPDKLVTRL